MVFGSFLLTTYGSKIPSALKVVMLGFSSNRTAGQATFGKPFPVAWQGKPCATDANTEASKQTAAGDGLFDLPEPPEPDFLEPFELLDRSLDPFRPFFSLRFFLALSLPLELWRAGVADRVFCGPSWEKSHAEPRLHLPIFQYLQGIFDGSFFFLSTDLDLPLLGVLSRFGGFSCL